jgi:chromosome condensin MukBEF ATPase and DNA-binding subunit MukB
MGDEKGREEAGKTTASRQRGDLISVDSTIDAIAQSALECARRTEELERLKRKAANASPSTPPAQKPPAGSGESR